MSSRKAVTPQTLLGDRAKAKITEDKFGLGMIADALAVTLTGNLGRYGYTIGIEGKWGSGKTSLANFIVEEIASQSIPNHRLVRFEPWLVGNRATLLTELFAALTAQVLEFKDDARLKGKLKASGGDFQRLAENLSRYSEHLDIAAKTIAIAGSIVPIAAPVASVLKKSADAVRAMHAPAKRLGDLKQSILDDLNTLEKLAPGVRFTVVIDDLDRLEAADAVEVLRLVAAVANFPLMTYLVCFDREVLAHQVSAILGEPNGENYIDKIFQSIVSVPPQEPFALKNLLVDLLDDAFPEEMRMPPSDIAMRVRRSFLFDIWVTALVRTPRDAARVCDAIKFGWPYLSGDADFGDFVWLQLVKLTHKTLYEWCRHYLATIGSYRDAGGPSPSEPETMAEELRAILSNMRLADKADLSGIRNFLPGLSNYFGSKDGKVFSFSRAELAEFEAAKRLGSPSHWRKYFSFELPSYAVDDVDISEFKKAALQKNKAAAVSIVMKLLSKKHTKLGHFLDVMIERIADQKEKLTTTETLGMAEVFAETMDDVGRALGEYFQPRSPWRNAERILSKDVAGSIDKILAHGKSVNWLADVLRGQGFRLGIPEQNGSDGATAWLTLDQFSSAVATLRARLNKMGLRKIVKLPEPLTVLYFCLQLGDAEAFKAEIAAFVAGDSNFLAFLDCTRAWSSNSSTSLIERRILRDFLDIGKAEDRLAKIAGQQNNIKTTLFARELQRAMRHGF